MRRSICFRCSSNCPQTVASLRVSAGVRSNSLAVVLVNLASLWSERQRAQFGVHWRLNVVNEPSSVKQVVHWHTSEGIGECIDDFNVYEVANHIRIVMAEVHDTVVFGAA